MHDLNQLVVGVVAEKPGGIIRTVQLLPNQNAVAPAIVPIDLPTSRSASRPGAGSIA